VTNFGGRKVDAVAVILEPSTCDTNFAEIRYTVARKYDRTTADDHGDWLGRTLGIETQDVARSGPD